MFASNTGAGGDSKYIAARNGSIAGLVDTAITVGAMIAANSTVLVADTFKTFLEFVAVFLSWMAIRQIRSSSEKEFNYGMHKLENVSGIIVASLMIVCLLVIVASALHNIHHPAHIGGIGIAISLAAQVVYFCINGKLYLGCKAAAKNENSPLIKSQANLFLTKSIGNAFILLSLVSSLLLKGFSWAIYIDPVASLIIACSILLGALGIFSSSFYDLLDKTLEESDQIIILRELAKHFDEYDELRGIRSRRAGSHAFVEIFLEFPPDSKVADAQRTINSIRASIEQKIPGSHVTIGLSDSNV